MAKKVAKKMGKKAGKKDKKGDKKSQKENKDQLSAVDKQFYEISTNDLNSKLSNSSTQNATLEERNAELETQMAQLEEDRADITAYLTRTLESQENIIKDFEEKLSEQATVRAEETESFQETIRDWETKFKAMQDELTSEIKLLNGKLNSLEEFRIQKDELMAKFDQQETNSKEQEQRHKEILYEMERKQIVEKVRLKNELENRLVQLSNEFVKSNEIRIASHVQRLTRENIALNNELDRLLNINERLRQENGTVCSQNSEQRQYNESILEENAKLVNACQKHVEILTRLTDESERLKEKLTETSEYEKLRKLAEVRATSSRKELNESKSKLKTMESTLDTQQKEYQMHIEIDLKYQAALNQLQSILRQIKRKILDAVSSTDDGNEDLEANRLKRQQLLDEFLHILVDVKEIDEMSTAQTPENDDKMTPLGSEIYRKGSVRYNIRA